MPFNPFRRRHGEDTKVLADGRLQTQETKQESIGTLSTGAVLVRLSPAVLRGPAGADPAPAGTLLLQIRETTLSQDGFRRVLRTHQSGE